MAVLDGRFLAQTWKLKIVLRHDVPGSGESDWTVDYRRIRVDVQGRCRDLVGPVAGGRARRVAAGRRCFRASRLATVRHLGGTALPSAEADRGKSDVLFAAGARETLSMDDASPEGGRLGPLDGRIGRGPGPR